MPEKRDVTALPLPEEVVNALEAARRVSFAFHGKHTRPAYAERWEEFLPQHESLIILDGWLKRVDNLAAPGVQSDLGSEACGEGNEPGPGAA